MAKARNPEALAAWIGRKNYGKAAMTRMAAAGRRRGGGSSMALGGGGRFKALTGQLRARGAGGRSRSRRR